VTLWYRSPELLLGETHYGGAIDIWATGCIFYELLCFKPLFPGKTEIDQISRIFTKLGTPNEAIWPGFLSLPHCQKFQFQQFAPTDWLAPLRETSSEAERELLQRCLIFPPQQRITAVDALRHLYFQEAPRPERYQLTESDLNPIVIGGPS